MPYCSLGFSCALTIRSWRITLQTMPTPAITCTTTLKGIKHENCVCIFQFRWKTWWHRVSQTQMFCTELMGVCFMKGTTSCVRLDFMRNRTYIDIYGSHIQNIARNTDVLDIQSMSNYSVNLLNLTWVLHKFGHFFSLVAHY